MYTRNIIQSVGGKLYFHTEVNVGTEFYVELEIQGIATGK
jgi:signal transduction histidine kinase